MRQRLLGFRKDGRPIWQVMGGDGTDDAGTADAGEDGDSEDTAGEPSGEDALRESGLRALDAERGNTKRARDELRPWKSLAKRYGLSPEQVAERLDGKVPGEGGQAVDAKQIRREVEQEVAAKANARIARSEVKALATRTFADPEDAVAFLSGDLADFVDDDGEVDVKGIETALKDLLRRKPHLAVKVDQDEGDFDGGSRTSGGTTNSMDDLIRAGANARRGIQ